MIPEDDMVAFRTSVSNHWSRKSAALMVISWTRLYLSSAGELLKSLAQARELFPVARVEGSRVGRNHRQNRLHEPAHRDHGLREIVVRLGVEFGMPLEFAPRLRVIVHAPKIVAFWQGVNVPSSGRISSPWRGKSRSRIISGRSSETT